MSTDTAMVPGSPPLLCGKVSRDIKQELDKLSIDIRAKKLRWFSECFSVTTSVMVLCDDMALYSILSCLPVDGHVSKYVKIHNTPRSGFSTRFYKRTAAAAACVHTLLLESFVIGQKLPYGILYLSQKGNCVPQPTQVYTNNNFI